MTPSVPFAERRIIEMKVLEEKLHQVIDQYLFHIGIIILVILSVAIRYHLAPVCVLSADYNDFIVPWFEYYQANGLGGLAEQVGDYYVPYNLFLALISYLPWKPWVMVSLFSCLCDYISAYYIYKIAYMIMENKGNESVIRRKAIIVGVVSVLIPVTFLNSGLWKQCDSVYVCFMIISLYFVLKEKYRTSLVFLGIGFCFKLQAIFLFPFFVVLYIGRKKNLSILHFLIIPLMYLLAGIPAVLAGRRITNVYGTYYRQMNHGGYNAMTINFPNLYGFGLSDYPALNLPFVMITLCIFIFMALFIQPYIKRLCRSNIVYIALWCMWTCTMFLPGMHERYNYAVVLLATIFFLIADWKKIWIAVILNLVSIVLYSVCLLGPVDISFSVLAIFHMIAYGYATYDLVNKIKETSDEQA